MAQKPNTQKTPTTATHWKSLADMPYIGAYALAGKKEMTLTIKNVVQELVIGNAGKKENCIVAYFQEPEKPMILNRTNCKTITKLYDTPIIEEWIGKKITIYKSTTSLMGEQVECLRIRPAVPQAEEKIYCQSCGAELTQVGGYDPKSLAAYTSGKYGKVLCGACATKIAQAIKEQEAIIAAEQAAAGKAEPNAPVEK